MSSQEMLSGRVVNTRNEAIESVLIKLIGQDGLIKDYNLSDRKGYFQLSFSNEAALVFSHLSYLNDTIDLQKLSVVTDSLFVLIERVNVLSEIIIKEDVSTIEQNNKTTFSNDEYFTGYEDNLEALILKIPGVSIDENGTIFFRGKQVSKVLLDGDDMFGSKYTIATRSIRPEFIESYDFIDEYLKEQMFKGFITSNELVLNVELKDEFKASWFGDGEVAIGVKDRYNAELNSYLIAKNIKSAAFIQKENLGLNKLGINIEEDVSEFRELDYDRSVSGSILSGMSYYLRGLESNNFNNDNNELVTTNLLLKKNQLENKSIVRWDGIRRSNYIEILRDFIGQDAKYESVKEKLYNRGRLDLFNTLRYQINDHFKINGSVEYSKSNIEAFDKAEVLFDQSNLSSSLESPGKSTHLKINLQSISRLSKNILTETNLTYIKGKFSEKGQQFDNQAQNPADSIFLDKQEYSEEISDLDINIRTYFKKKKYKWGVKLGYLKRKDHLSNTLYNNSNESEQQDGKREVASPYIGGWAEWKYRKIGFKFESDYLFTSENLNANTIDVLDHSRITLTYKPNRQFSVFVNYRNYKSLASSLSALNLTYFTNELDVVTQNNDFRSRRTTAIFFGANYFDTSKLFEIRTSVLYRSKENPRRVVSLDGLSESSQTLGLAKVPYYSANIVFDKYIKTLKSNLGVGISGSENHINFTYQDISTYTITQRSLYISLSSKSLDKVAFNLKSSLYYSKYEGLNDGAIIRKNSIKYLENKVGLNLFPLDKKQLKIYAELTTFSGREGIGFLDQSIVDIGSTYLISDDVDLSFRVNNLLDLSEFRVNEMGFSSNTNYTASVIPRFIYVSISKTLK